MSYKLIISQFITFLYAPVMAFFLFLALPALIVCIANFFTGQPNTQLPIISISIALLYLIITPPALCSGLIYSLCTLYRKTPLLWTITTLIYTVFCVVWCSALTFKLTGHLPALQAFFSNNASISYEVIWSACLFALLFAVASLGFFPIAILSRMMTAKPQRRIFHIIWLCALIMPLLFIFVDKTRWFPTVQAILQ